MTPVKLACLSHYRGTLPTSALGGQTSTAFLNFLINVNLTAKHLEAVIKVFLDTL